MKINEEVKQLLKEYNIPVKDAIAYLITVYFDCVPSYTPSLLIEKIQRTNLIKYKSPTNVEWAIPLFQEQITGFDWVKDWMDEFGKLNKERRGTRGLVEARMKKFFATYPDIRKDDVLIATEMYLKSIENPMYIMKSHKFIMNGVGLEKTSELKEWVDKYREHQEENTDRNSYSNTMIN